ncbi:MAG: NAD(P)/FAD-dependent oxidoreductase [Acidobacteriaceae bacterium]
MTGHADVIVIGAGIVGAACARACAAQGLKTLVVDAAAGIGGGATAAAMGHIVVMDDSPAQLALTRRSQQLWDGVFAELPAEVEFQRRGTLWIAADEQEMQEVRRKQAVYAAAGVHTEILDARTLAEAEPELRPCLVGALLVPADAVLYPPAAAAWLLQQAVNLGAENLASQAVVAAAKGEVRMKDGSKLCAAWIVNACGTGSTQLLPGLPIRKRRGHLVITERYPGFVHHQLLELGYLKSAHSVARESTAFNVQPRQTGQLLIGSSREFGAEHTGINHSLMAAMLRRAELYLPRISRLRAIRAWTGFRAATPDKLPLIGPWPEDGSLLLATGHEGLGITTSLATGELIAAHIAGTRPGIPAEPYLPIRFLNANPAVPEQLLFGKSDCD